MTGIPPYMLCGNMLGKRVTVTKKDGSTFTGILKSYTVNAQLSFYRDITPYLRMREEKEELILGDSTITLGETRVRLTGSDTITVEDGE